MSVFDLFRGFFGVPGGHYRGEGRRDPFFDNMTRDDDDEDDEDFSYSGCEGCHQDPFDEALRFGFSFGPSGVRIQEPQLFGQVLREMEELFAGLGNWERPPGIGQFGIPSIEPPPPQDNAESGVEGGRGRSLRDFMLKSPDSSSPPDPSGAPDDSRTSPFRSPFHHWSPFSKFNDMWRGGLKRGGEEDTVREDRDLDSRVSSEGLDQILTPAPTQPKTRSFFQSVTVTKVVKPDGTVEERRIVRDSQGNEETTVTRSGPEDSRGPQDLLGPLGPSLSSPSADQRDEGCIFAKYFGGFKG